MSYHFIAPKILISLKKKMFYAIMPDKNKQENSEIIVHIPNSKSTSNISINRSYSKYIYLLLTPLIQLILPAWYDECDRGR